ncbi:MAG: glycosyltransferase family 2 protein [Eubacteriales bacterium]|nr:glycosyltransferase family 2 protein [Eubacteriales bacterium]
METREKVRKRVSVVMAVYNGETYLKEQIESIIDQLDENDELIISVDPSGDTSKEIAAVYAKNDGRILVCDGPGKGVIANFENVLRLVNGGYIFLSDQDDIWYKEKLEKCITRLKDDNALMVIHDCTLIDSEGNIIGPSFFGGRFTSSVIQNIIKNRFIGCCMAFRIELLDTALPFPKNLPMHDQWLGMVASKAGSVVYIDEPLLYYRRHSETMTGRKKSSIFMMIKWRVNILTDYLKLN